MRHAVRLFIGCPVPPSPAYTEATADLITRHDARPVPSGSWHVTLRFLGDVPDAAPVGAALEAAVTQAAVPCTVRGVGAFPSPRRARLAWAGVEAPGLEAVAQAVVAATRDIGQPPDARPFVPHVTLARLPHPQDVSPWVSQHTGVLAQGAFAEVVLYESRLGPGGPTYEALARFALD